jgi:hypothetical protein
METEDQGTIAALLEANELLGEDNARLRNSCAVLRNVNRSLRETLRVLKSQNETAAANDEAFKNFCAEPVAMTVDYKTIAESMKDGETRQFVKEFINDESVQKQFAEKGLAINKDAINKFFGEGTV